MLPTAPWRLRLDEMDIDHLRRCAELWHRVWPSDGGLTATLAKVRALLGQAYYREAMIHGVDLAGRPVALARSFVRRIGTAEGEREVLALAGVCTQSDCRGGGFGRLVVRDAFARLGPRLSVCLFQTQVPAFYRKLDCREIDNPVVDSTGTGSGFWDPHVMIHPAAADWPVGEVDIRGPGW